MLLLFSASGQVSAAEEDEISEPVEFVAPQLDQSVVMTRTTQGVIHLIDLENRTAEISGFLYAFGEPNDLSPGQVIMSGSDYGAFELLQPGMKVEIDYVETGEIRLVVRLQQLANEAEIELS